MLRRRRESVRMCKWTLDVKGGFPGKVASAVNSEGQGMRGEGCLWEVRPDGSQRGRASGPRVGIVLVLRAMGGTDRVKAGEQFKFKFIF